VDAPHAGVAAVGSGGVGAGEGDQCQVSAATLFAIYPLMSTPLAMGACYLLLGLALG